jgi:hypothetical protein
MKYLLMTYSDETSWGALTDPEREARVAQYSAFAQQARERGALLAGDELQPTANATTVRVDDGKTIVTDGPYAETKEALGGFFLLEARSIDEAVEHAKQLPAPVSAGGIEIRPVYLDEGAES